MRERDGGRVCNKGLDLNSPCYTYRYTVLAHCSHKEA